jgi:WD40 repeat protein
VPASPYRGIQPFRYADHTIFFAREDETRRLGRLVDVYRGVFLYGASGNGKSSLVNAGLLPQARGLGFEPVRVRLQPRAGEELVIEQLAISDDGIEMLPCLLAPEDDGGSRIVLSITEFERRVRAVAQAHQPLLVFDQFEEILTLFEDEDEEAVASRRSLAEMIVRLLREPLPVKLLFAFRDDYLGGVKQLLSARPELVDQALRLGPPSADALQTIIRGPFERFPGRFERELDPALAQRLRAALAERFGSGEVSLSEVQTVCLRLWQCPQPEALLAEKGVQGLLEDELGEALDAFPADLRSAAVALLSQMVTSAGTRNVVSAEDLRQRVREAEPEVAAPLLDEALDRLERESKLVRRERRRDIYLYEITSEFLVPWISRRRDELRLAHARRRERRRLRILGSIAGGLLILAAVVAAVAVWALRQSAEAQRQATDARSLALAASSAKPLVTRPDISLALAFEAYRERPQTDTSSAVIRALREARRSGLRGVLAAIGAPYGVAFSPDGKTLAAASFDKTIRLWSTATRTQIGLLRGHTDLVNRVIFSPDGKTLASASNDTTVRVWSSTTHRQLADLSAHSGAVYGVAFSPDGKTLASAGDDGTIRLWNPATHREIGSLKGHEGPVFGIAFSPDGKTLASASDDNTVRLWKAATQRDLGSLKGHHGAVFRVAFSPDGKTLASAGWDKSVRIWNLASRKQLVNLSGHAAPVNDVTFSPDGKTLATSSNDHTARLWNPVTGAQLARLSGHADSVFGLAFSPDGRTLATGSDDRTIRLWNPATRSKGDSLSGHSIRALRSVAFSPDGKILAAAGFSHTVRLWSPVDRRPLGSLPGHARPVNGMAFSPDGKTLAAATFNNTIRLWNPATSERLGSLGGQTGPLNGVAFTPDGKTLAGASDDGTVRMWNVTMRKPLGRLSGHTGHVNGVVFSPDGRTLASASDDGTVRMWNVATRKPLGRLSGNTGPVYGVAFSPDGKTLATANDDTTIRLWNPVTRRQLASLSGHTGPVYGVAFSSDGQTLASAGDDKTVRLWNLATHKELGSLTGHTGPVRSVAFSPDGRTLASAGDDKTVRLWHDVVWRNLADLQATVCDVLLTGIGRAEWNQYARGIPYRRSCP